MAQTLGCHPGLVCAARYGAWKIGAKKAEQLFVKLLRGIRLTRGERYD
jgi:hypothetical protein